MVPDPGRQGIRRCSETDGYGLHPSGRRRSPRQMWLAHATTARGAVSIDEGAVKALRDRQASLLAAGVVSVSGNFSAGEPVDIVDGAGVPVVQGTGRLRRPRVRTAGGTHDLGVDRAVRARVRARDRAPGTTSCCCKGCAKLGVNCPLRLSLRARLWDTGLMTHATAEQVHAVGRRAQIAERTLRTPDPRAEGHRAAGYRRCFGSQCRANHCRQRAGTFRPPTVR